MFRVNANKKLSEGERGSIVSLSRSGFSVSEIAIQLACSRSTVRLWQQRFADTGEIKRKEGSSRPRKTNQLQDMRMIARVREQPITTTREIAGI